MAKKSEGPSQDLVGKRLGNYELVAELGRGGMAQVYRAVQPSIGRVVAVKVLPQHFLQDKNFIERFTREVKVIAKLQHPHILPVIDYGDENGIPYIVMAYMEGGTLADKINKSEWGMDPDEVVRLTKQIAEGLDFAHKQGIIHRDFKPSNVLLDGQSNAYLSDFGVARIAESSSSLTGSGVVGTPAYMAPELSQPGGLSPLVDIYGLGVTVFEMLTGNAPYDATTPMGVLVAHVTEPIPDVSKMRPELPPGVQQVIAKALAKDPANRYQTARALANDLDAAIKGTLQSAEPADDGVLERPSAKGKPALAGVPIWMMAAGGVAVLVVIGGVIALASSGGGTASRATPTPTLPPVGMSADSPIEANTDWTPVIQEFGGYQMALVPTGCFVMGSADGASNEGPINQQCFDHPFWIDRFEMTNFQFGGEGSFAGDQRPRDSVTWTDAEIFCETRHMHLPTEAEWEYAARGPNGFTYPWGTTFDATALMAIFADVSGGEPANVDETRTAGASWVGALDMAGNLWEWTSSIYAPYPYVASDGREDMADTTSNRVVRGGSYLDGQNALRASVRVANAPTTSNPTIGFRCAGIY